jgi:ATP synthase protein I
MDRTHRPSRDSGVAVLLGGLVVIVVLGLLAAVVAGLVSGAPGAWGALVGALLVAVVCVGGSLLVNAVAGLMPSASLLVALLTYTLQVLLLGLVFVGLTSSGATDGALDPRWLGGTVVAATLAWTVWLVVREVRTRRPVYDVAVPDGVPHR